MGRRNISVCIECGEKGVGKTTYVKQKWNHNILIACGDPLNRVKTSSALFLALQQIYHALTDELLDIVLHLRKALQDGYVLIIDEAEHIDEALLKTIVNTVFLGQDHTIVFTFDIDHKFLYQSKIFRLLIEWDMVSSSRALTNFCASTDELEAYISESIPGVCQKLKDELIEASDRNFGNLKRLLWLVINRQSDLGQISEAVLTEYSYFLVEEKLSSLSLDLLDILKKSSLIGELFQSCILESPDGFHFPGVKTYLQKLEATHMFIQSYLQDEIYKFISSKIYSSVLKSIEPHEKIASQKILLHYYLAQLASERESNKVLECLRQLKRLSYDLNDYEMMLFAEKRLLFQYLKIGDVAKARVTMIDLLTFCEKHMDDELLYLYLSYYSIRLQITTGYYDVAIMQINALRRKIPTHSNLYLQYYYAKSLYGIGDVDRAYQEVRELCVTLKGTSSKAGEDQPIYALAYSLFATIQHHFGIDDLGKRYYALALNHSKYKLTNKAVYFEILKKCDMYYEFCHSAPLLTQSISYFKATGKIYDAAEVCVNLATEMMFTSKDHALRAESYFEKAIKIFSKMPNESLAYAQNNRAILFIMHHGDFQSAGSLLENSLFVGMSAFTYMTLYLNLCMCHLALHGCDSTQFKQAYKDFCKYHSIIKSRKYATQYDDMYKKLLDIILLERNGDSESVIEQTKCLLSSETSAFFRPILEDIHARNSISDHMDHTYKMGYHDNSAYYEALNSLRIFLAEFRFWE